jgi:hypothetical protein
MTYTSENLMQSCRKCRQPLQYVTTIANAGSSALRIYNCATCERLEWVTAPTAIKSPKQSMQAFKFRCTTTGREAQGWTEAIERNRFEPAVCTECERVHFINLATGEDLVMTAKTSRIV